MPYKDKEARLKWARDKYATCENTRKLARLRIEKRRHKKVPTTPKAGDINFYKAQARYAVRNAIKSGVLIKLPCVVCGNSKSQAHHEDHYKKLDVIWLCTKHHGEIHRKL